MNEDLRRRYLAAMSIDCWAARERPVAEAAPERPGPPPATVPIPLLDWDGVAREVQTCQRCSLHVSRTQTVFGTGSRSAAWLFVGEAPGADEDRQGEPFVGRAGQLLNAMLFALGLKREDVYIANVLKCRPPGNRDPSELEVNCCAPFLKRQIELVAPQVIVAMGRFAAGSLLQRDDPLGRLRGRVLAYEHWPLVVTYHPAYLLRTPTEKRKAWEDLMLARAQVQGS